MMGYEGGSGFVLEHLEDKCGVLSTGPEPSTRGLVEGAFYSI